jgi:parvulin-like peptidyl-prolyl isomerase
MSRSDSPHGRLSTARLLLPLAMLAVGLGAGWYARGPVAALKPSSVAPDSWVAQVGDEYVSVQQVLDEMRMRGGSRPGAYQSVEQRRALLDDLLFRRALIQAAEAEGMQNVPEVRRALDTLLASRYLQQRLGALQAEVQVSDEEVRARFESEAARYAVPPRRRIAVLQLNIPEGANADEVAAIEARLREARAEVAALPEEVRHFGAVAQTHSEDTDTRYRGGVFGWIADQENEADANARLPGPVLVAARALREPGELSPALRTGGAFYLVRLVDLDAGRTRSFDELAPGIREGLRQERLLAIESAFRSDLLERSGIQVREPVLAAIDPLSPPAAAEPKQPPALPGDRG